MIQENRPFFGAAPKPKPPHTLRMRRFGKNWKEGVETAGVEPASGEDNHKAFYMLSRSIVFTSLPERQELRVRVPLCLESGAQRSPTEVYLGVCASTMAGR